MIRVRALYRNGMNNLRRFLGSELKIREDRTPTVILSTLLILEAIAKVALAVATAPIDKGMYCIIRTKLPLLMRRLSCANQSR